MRVVFVLAVLAVVLVAGLEEREEQAVASLEQADTLQREARDARRRRKGKGLKKKGKNNGRRRKQRRRKLSKKGKKGANKKGMRGQARKAERQTTDCLADVVLAVKNYKKAQTQLRQGNRIKSWKKNMDSKKGKAADQFKNASDAMETATGGGKSCNGGAADAEATSAQAILKNCSVTAAMKCDAAMITGYNSSKIETCATTTKDYVKAFDACIKDGTCACFTALPAFDKDMCNMTTTYDSAKTSKTGCNSPKEAGSFGECSKNQKMAGQFVGKCTQACPMMTTKMARQFNIRKNSFL